ncbi:Hypothetical protein HVR_LOCUS259 [uncultured virus]|nr:Hypothetical protein HVR_LOCUS259 [uncultured virus]
MDSVHTKIVTSSELEFFHLAHKHHLTPALLSYSQLPDDHPLYPGFSVSTRLFPETLFDVMEDKSRFEESLFILSRARELLSSLHSINILHNDPSEENIVYDKSTSSVALIDFGLSKFISSISTSDIPTIVENLCEGVRFAGTQSNSIEYLLQVELGIISFLESRVEKN